MLAHFETIWNSRETPFNSPPQFFNYFQTNKAALFKDAMIKPVRVKAGLGDPPKNYHNNDPECMNNVIKMKVERKKHSSLDEFCSQMKSLVQDQHSHLIRAITRRGEYRLHPMFKKFELSPSKWFEMSETDRQKHVTKLNSAAKKLATASLSQAHDPNQSSSSINSSATDTTSDTSAGITSCSTSGEPQASSRSAPSATPAHNTLDWTLTAQICDNTTIPLSTISGIWEKAEVLLRDPSAITKAPVDGEARMVRSYSQPCRPHLVQILKDGKIVCDQNCPIWASIKICSYCVAIAHSIGCTSKYAMWFSENTHKPINLTKLTTQKVTRDVGKKPSNRHSQLKGPKQAITARTQAISSSSTTSTASAVSVTHTSQSYSNQNPIQLSSLSPCGQSTSGYFPTQNQFGFSHTSTPTQLGFLPTHMQTPVTFPPALASLGLPLNSTACTPTTSLVYPSQLSFTTGVPFTQPSRLVFRVCKLNNRITTCYGCRAKFMRGADGSVPVPPFDLILKCSEMREYYGKDGNKRQKENCNTYYHPNITCIRAKHPDFKLCDIEIEDAVWGTLLQSHFDLLQCAFNFH